MRIQQVAILAIVILLFSACKDDASEIGGGLFPGEEIISTHEYITSTDDVETSNVESDAIEFSTISSFIIGEFDDPKFGKTKADFLSQLSLGVRDTNKLKYNDNYELDSTKFRIRYPNNSWLGDTLAKHKISIYELTSPLDPLATYKSDFDPTGMYDPNNPIGEEVFYARNSLIDTAWTTTDSYVHTIYIDIDEEIGTTLFEADSATITNPSAFNDLFNGIYLTTEKMDSRDGSLVKLNYRSYSHDLVLYYKRINYDETSGEIADTTQFVKSFPINIESVKINKYTHDYTESEIDFGDPNVSNLFVQPMAGSSCKYNISETFESYWKEKLEETDTIHSIAGVTLSFYIDTLNTEYRDYSVPTTLDIFAKNDNGDFVTPIFENEFGQTTAAYSSGTLSYSITEAGVVYPYKYTFTMSTGYFEEYINPQIPSNIDRNNYSELYIAPQNPSSNFNRVVLHGAAIVKDEDDETIRPTNMSIKYVKLQ